MEGGELKATIYEASEKRPFRCALKMLSRSPSREDSGPNERAPKRTGSYV